MKQLISARKNFFSKHFNPNSIFQLIMAVLLVGTAFAPTQAAFAAGTLTVNRADDIAPRGVASSCNTAASSDCTLREAVIKANANPGSTIQFASGLNGTPIILSIPGNDADAATGDLDINASTNIVGNGSSATIIQGALNASYAGSIGDKVFGVNQDGTHDSLTVHFSGLTIRYGDNTIPLSDPLYAFTGGGVDVFQTGLGNVTTFTDCVISFNRNHFSYGGGLNFDQAGVSSGYSVDATGSLTLTNVTFDGNQTMAGTTTLTGGALNIFGLAPVVNITGSTFTNNSTHAVTAAGGAIFYRPNTGGSLSIHNTDFNGNSAGGLGGAVYLNILDASTVITIDQGTKIRNNVSGGVAGGSAGGSGIFIGGNVVTTTPVSLSKVTITGNSESALSSSSSRQGGGGILVNIANTTISYSRIAGNTVLSASGGTGLLKNALDPGTVTATNNWWGCSTGPGAAPCDTAVILGGPGTLSTSPFLRLKTTASPSTINVGQGSAMTSTFLTDSANNPVALANLDVLLGLPVSWSAVHGSLSGQQTTIQPSGTATASFTQDNTCNNSSVTAQVDNGPASGGPNTANITVQCPDLTAVKTNDVSGSVPLPTSWNWTVHMANGGAGFAPFANGNTVLTDNLPNSGLAFGSPSVSNASGLTGTVSCAIDGSDNLGCTANGAVQLNAGGSFDVTFSVTPSAGGSYLNPRAAGICKVDPGNVVSETLESNNTCSNTVTVIVPPVIGKAFGVASMPLNNTTSLTFTITNPLGDPVSLTGVAFTDTLPGGLVVATPNGLANTCGGTATAVAGSGSVSLSGVSLATNTSCTVTVNVLGTTEGVKNNSVTVSSTNGGTGNTANATVSIASPPTIAKSFGAAGIPANGNTSLSFTINNPNSSISLSGIGFTDNLPSGLLVSTPNGLTGSCGGGSITASAGANSVSLSGATLAAGASCTFSTNVTGITGGVKNNSVQVTSTEGGTGNTSSASLTVFSPPAIGKSFGAASIPLNGSTSLSFTLTNPNAGTGLTGVGFTDNLPAGLVVSTPAGVSGSCGGGTITAVAASGSISLVGASLAASTSCTFSVNVDGISAGTQNNTTGNVTSTEGGTGGSASASINVLAPPSISKAFGASSIALNGTTSLTITITNPAANAVSLTGVAFTDNLPSGLIVATPGNASSTCGGTTTALDGASSVSLLGATLASAASCSVSVDVQGTTEGVKNNSVQVSSTNGGTGNTANATVTVASAPTIAKSFGAASIPQNGSTTLIFDLSNPNTSITLTGIGFTDNLPAGLVVSTPPGLTGGCGGGTITANAADTSVSLSGASLAAAANCSFTVSVTGSTAGLKNNSVSVTSTEGGTGNTSNASITVLAPALLTKGFGAASIPLNGSTSLSFTVQNNNTTQGLSGIGFTDTLPAGLVISTPSGLTGSCGGGSIVATAGLGTISLTGASLSASSSCTFSVNVDGTTAGTKVNTTGSITSTQGGTGSAASASIDVVAPPVISKSFGASGIALNGTTILTLTLTNPAVNGVALTGVAFTDNLPSGLIIATPGNLSSTCGGTATGVDSGNVVSLSGATLTTSTTCVISVNVQGTSEGVKNNSVTVSSTNGGTGNTSNASLTVAVPPTISKSFGAAAIALNGSTTLSFQLTNPGTATTLTGIGFSDSLPAGLVVSTPNGLTGSCGGGTIAATAGSGSVSLSGASLAVGASCNFSVSVKGTTGGVKNNSVQVNSTEGGVGNTSNASLTVDNTAPDTAINSNPADPINNTSASFTFSGTDDLTPSGALTFECKLDAGAFAACTSAKTYSSLADGSHTFQVRAVDGVGNVDATPASYTWIVDTTAPDTTITANPSNPSNLTSASFSFTGSDGSGSGVASFQCQLDGGGFSACTSPQSYTGLSTGGHTFQVRAIDNVGLTDASPASFAWTIDTTPPTVTIDQASGQGDPTSLAPVNFTATFSEPVTGFAGSDVNLSASTVPGTLSASVSGGPTIYNVAVSGMTGDGTVIASIPSGSFTDLAGNSGAASTSTDNTVSYIFAAPPIITEGGSTSVTMSQNGTPTPFALTLHATDANSDPLTWSILSQANSGTASAVAGPSDSSVISYTPLPNYYGTDAFVVQVSDGVLTDTINVGVIIQPNGNPGPLVWNQSYDIQYDTWLGVVDTSAFNGGYRKATSGNFKFVAPVATTQFTWLTYRGPDQGKAQVLVDGVVKATVNLYNPTAQWQYPVVIAGLKNMKHTVVIKPLNQKVPASSGKWVVVDGFMVGANVYDEQSIRTSGMFSYGSWLGLRTSRARFGAYRYSNMALASLKFGFDGIGFNWVTVRGPSYGKAAIYVDGHLMKIVDLYKPGAEQWQYHVKIDGLAYGHHDVKIVVLGTRNARSSGIGIVCDGFELW